VKILHIIYDDVHNPWVGGGGAIRAREINRLLAGRHAVTLLTGNYRGARSGDIDGIRYVRLGSGKRYFLSRLTFSILVPFALRKYDCDLIVNDFSIFSPCFIQWYTRKPVVNMFHHIIGAQVLRKFFFLGIFAYIFEKIFMQTAKNIITVSDSVQAKIERSGKDRRIECIYNGVDADLFTAASSQGGYIAFLGRLDVYMKGLDLLLKAFARIPDASVRLKIAGSGPEKNVKRLRALAHRLRLDDRVAFLGRIGREEKKDFLSHALFVVMPSRFEGWGIAAIEAAACGKAVIGSAIPGLRDAIIDGKTGLLVESGNIREFTDAMTALLQDEKRRSMMEKNGKRWAQNFQWEIIARKQEAFYREVLESSGIFQ